MARAVTEPSQHHSSSMLQKERARQEAKVCSRNCLIHDYLYQVKYTIEFLRKGANGRIILCFTVKSLELLVCIVSDALTSTRYTEYILGTNRACFGGLACAF